MRTFVLRRPNEDSEGSKYHYFVSCNNGVEIVTQTKETATVFIEGQEIKVGSNDWKPVLVKKTK